MTKLFHTFPLPSEIGAWGGIDWVRRMVDLGVYAFRFGADRSVVNPSEGVQNRGEFEAALELIQRGGGHWYNNPKGAAPWAANGTRCYVGGVLEEGGVLEWVPGTQDGSVQYTTNAALRAQCIPPPPMDADALTEFAADEEKRYGSMTALDGDPFVILRAFGNEPDDVNNSTGQAKLIQPYEQVGDFVYDTQLVPYAKGVRSVTPNALIAGSEAATHGFAAHILVRDNASPVRYIDVSSAHLYPDRATRGGFPDGALAKIDGQEGSYAAWMDPVMNGRKEMCGEVGLAIPPPNALPQPPWTDDPYSVLKYLLKVLNSGRWTYFTFMLLDMLVFKRSPAGGRTTEPNDLYAPVQAIVHAARHRAVRH